MSPADPADDALLGELAALLRERDQPPASVIDAAKQLYPWRTVDAELADLTYDSLLEPAGVRSAGQPRVLVFEGAGLPLELEVEEAPGRRLLGQVGAPGISQLELRGTSGEAARARTDELGRFVIPLPARPEPLSLRCTTADGRRVATSWSVL